MYKSDVVDHFGTQKNLAEKLGVTAAAVSAWDRVIPEKQALRLERLTSGQLIYQPALYQTNPAALSGS